MKRIMFCCELGGGLGHIFRLLPIGFELKKMGYSLFWALPAQWKCDELLHQYGFEVVSSPPNNFRAPILPFSQNYAQNLLRNGYANRVFLRKIISLWRDLLYRFRPDLVVSEHAPTALLAAGSMTIPRVALGTGFSLPPLKYPMPGLQAWFSIPEEHLLRIERSFIAVVNPVLKTIGCQVLEKVADIFKGVETFLCTYPELDHYEKRSDMQYQGAIEYSSKKMDPVWPSKGRNNVFIYMNSQNRSLFPVVEHIQKLGLTALAFVPGISQDDRCLLEKKGVMISPYPVNLSSAKERCLFAVTAAGHNTGALLLRQGIPLLLCPSQMEQALWAYRISTRGLALIVNIFDSEPDYRKKILTMLDPSEMAVCVGSFAMKYSKFSIEEKTLKIANQISILDDSNYL
ncbi:MAG: hypothetical protein HQK65_14345 [Desulfamplus sp.]|nr:hypothetical protein [Desulfamplus sp.]